MPSEPAWSFLTNHAQVLVCIGRNPGILLKEVAAQMGVTERAVQRIIADLVEDGSIVRIRVGRQNRYQINGDRRLPHSIESGVRIHEALRLFGVQLSPDGAAPSDGLA
jgi:DNA-binding Lrp family transcriptional regulator